MAMPLTVAGEAAVGDPVALPGAEAMLAPLPAGAAAPQAGLEYGPMWGYDGSGGSRRGPYDPGWQPWDDPGWSWQWLPHGRVYPTYLADQRESRMAVQFLSERSRGGLMHATLGGRAGIVRLGTENLVRPEGYQLDFEAAAFPRVTLDDRREFVSSDFRVGAPLGFRRGPVEAKFAYYHYCSHLGDAYLENHPGATRSAYIRDALVLGLGFRPREELRLYAEADYAVYVFGNTKPWQFQFGAEWSTLEPSGLRGAPFFAINGLLREDVDFGGNLTVQTGWQWRGRAGELVRTGFHYFNGKSNQGQFFDQFEEHLGIGLWYDF